jgi:hypothetical protein
MFSVEPAKVAVKTILRARPGLAGVFVERGMPAKVPTEHERIYIATTRGVHRDPPPDHGEDVFIVNLMIEVVGKRGATHEATEARMWAIANEVDAQVRADPEWGVALCSSWLTLDGEHTAPTAEGAYVSRGLFALNCVDRM